MPLQSFFLPFLPVDCFHTRILNLCTTHIKRLKKRKKTFSTKSACTFSDSALMLSFRFLLILSDKKATWITYRVHRVYIYIYKTKQNKKKTKKRLKPNLKCATSNFPSVYIAFTYTNHRHRLLCMEMWKERERNIKPRWKPCANKNLNTNIVKQSTASIATTARQVNTIRST